MIRDKSIQALAEAYGDDGDARWKAEWLLREPTGTLARRLDFATAWDEAGPEGIARLFHEAYERLAPDHGYETRRDSAVPWEDVPQRNRELMVATVVALTAALRERQP